MIVPNSQLISEEVVNWTGSDDRRRIDIPIGVAYGTSPGEVLSILKALPLKFDGVLKEPAPRALFIGMAEFARFRTSHLDTRRGRMVTLRSDLAILDLHGAKRSQHRDPIPAKMFTYVRPNDLSIVRPRPGQ